MKQNTTFLFAGGIENTFINAPHPVTGKKLDEYQLLGHYTNWKKDLDLLADLGLDALRWGVPWFQVNPKPGVFQWEFVDEVLTYLCETLGIRPIVDMLHYGTPDWLPNSFMEPGFLEAYQRYVEEFCSRYRGLIDMATPVNEPCTTADFCGRKGEWPPYGRDDKTFYSIMLNLSEAAIQGSRIISEAGMQVVHVEVTGDHLAWNEGAKGRADDLNAEFRMYWDAVTGRLGKNHALAERMLAGGIDERRLEEFTGPSAVIDIAGINFYPQWSVKLITKEDNGSFQDAELQSNARKLKGLISDFAEDIGKPVMVTETSVAGPVWRKKDWLQDSIKVCKELVNQKVPLVGYTWFPLIDMIDWAYRIRTGPPEDFLMDLGLWDLNRKPKSAAEEYRKMIEWWKEELNNDPSS